MRNYKRFVVDISRLMLLTVEIAVGRSSTQGGTTGVRDLKNRKSSYFAAYCGILNACKAVK